MSIASVLCVQGGLIAPQPLVFTMVSTRLSPCCSRHQRNTNHYCLKSNVAFNRRRIFFLTTGRGDESGIVCLACRQQHSTVRYTHGTFGLMKVMESQQMAVYVRDGREVVSEQAHAVLCILRAYFTHTSRKCPAELSDRKRITCET